METSDCCYRIDPGKVTKLSLWWTQDDYAYVWESGCVFVRGKQEKRWARDRNQSNIMQISTDRSTNHNNWTTFQLIAEAFLLFLSRISQLSSHFCVCVTSSLWCWLLDTVGLIISRLPACFNEGECLSVWAERLAYPRSSTLSLGNIGMKWKAVNWWAGM